MSKEARNQIKESVKSKNFKTAARLLFLLRLRNLQISDLKSLDRIIGENFDELASVAKEMDIRRLKVAILGNYTFDTLVAAIRITLFTKGFLADIYQNDYGLMEQDIINPGSKYYAFKPDITLLSTGYRDIKEFPQPDTDQEAINRMVEDQVKRYKSFWKSISEKTASHIIQNNFDVPIERVFGELEAKYPWTRSNFMRRLNLRLGEAAPGYVSILDIEHLSSILGKACWFDDRFYYHSKDGFSFECMPEYANLFSSLVCAVKGRSKKCLVIDLDNTLWGGVIGDDGIGNIRFGQGSPEGEAYLEFAEYINSLKNRGIIIAVCSKNEEETAKEPFLKLKEMPFRLEDISVFIANWDDKATNLRRISQRLNIGLDSLVFVDDDPLERELVKRFLPMVDVVELPPDPSLYKRTVYEGHYFETTGFSREDKSRTEFYYAQKKLEEEKGNFEDLNSFLSSLKISCSISRFTEVDLMRITQLVNKTNQFNLTTRRYNEAEIRGFMQDEDCFTISVRLKDKFSDYGLISVFIGIINGSSIDIDTWLMSCRAFSRGAEHFLFNCVLKDFKEMGIETIKGTYIPTKKNALVKDFYKSLGFSPLKETEDGVAIWYLNIKERLPFLETHIAKEEASLISG